MKQCALCHTIADDAAPTCAACGEGSWNLLAPTPQKIAEEPVTATARKERRK